MPREAVGDVLYPTITEAREAKEAFPRDDTYYICITKRARGYKLTTRPRVVKGGRRGRPKGVKRKVLEKLEGLSDEGIARVFEYIDLVAADTN